jgi:hypothetical protein
VSCSPFILDLRALAPNAALSVHVKSSRPFGPWLAGVCLATSLEITSPEHNVLGSQTCSVAWNDELNGSETRGSLPRAEGQEKVESRRGEILRFVIGRYGQVPVGPAWHAAEMPQAASKQTAVM